MHSRSWHCRQHPCTILRVGQLYSRMCQKPTTEKCYIKRTTPRSLGQDRAGSTALAGVQPQIRQLRQRPQCARPYRTQVPAGRGNAFVLGQAHYQEKHPLPAQAALLPGKASSERFSHTKKRKHHSSHLEPKNILIASKVRNTHTSGRQTVTSLQKHLRHILIMIRQRG